MDYKEALEKYLKDRGESLDTCEKRTKFKLAHLELMKLYPLIRICQHCKDKEENEDVRF